MKQKNEAGYTLVLVLLIITLIFIFSVTLISNVLNSAWQNKKSEENIQLHQSSQMGVTYVEQAIKKVSELASPPVKTWIEGQLKSNPNTPPSDDAIADRYKFEFENKLTYFTSSEIISTTANQYRFKVDKLSIKRADKTITVQYTIIPSLNNVYAQPDPVRKKTINITIK